jgi:hypothetical protein
MNLSASKLHNPFSQAEKDRRKENNFYNYYDLHSLFVDYDLLKKKKNPNSMNSSNYNFLFSAIFDSENVSFLN